VLSSLEKEEIIMIKKKLIACQIFTDELSAVLLEEHRDIDVTWLNAGLHMNLDKLETTLKQALKDAAIEGADARFLFGRGCHPDMCHIINNHGGKVLGAKNCIEAFCHENIDELEKNRTMVITPSWIRFFPNLMAAAGWDEVDVRQNFGRYDRFLLMDTGINPLSEEEILEFYDLTQVPIEIQQISLDHFREKLIEVLR
jgi:uncharacterized protein DUF1638